MCPNVCYNTLIQIAAQHSSIAVGGLIFVRGGEGGGMIVLCSFATDLSLHARVPFDSQSFSFIA